jgi:hypothetical protein
VNDALARRYETLLRAYPEAYRNERGDEMMGILLERGGHRRWPPARELLGLLVGGLRVRLSPGGATRTVWADGLRLAVVALLVVELVEFALPLLKDGSRGRSDLAMLAFGLLAFHTVLRGRHVVALLATLAWQTTSVWAGHVSMALGTAVPVHRRRASGASAMRLPRPAWVNLGT